MEQAKILMVEDEAVIGADYMTRLKTMGYVVLDIVESGEEAIKKAEELKPDIILMDITIEGNKDGIQAAEEITERFGMPIVCLTAHSYDATMEKYFKERPAYYLTKPVRDEKLNTTIKMALSYF